MTGPHNMLSNIHQQHWQRDLVEQCSWCWCFALLLLSLWQHAGLCCPSTCCRRGSGVSEGLDMVLV